MILGIEPPKRLRKKSLLESLDSISPPLFAKVLEHLEDEELRLACRTAGCDDSGTREKLKARLLHRGETPPPSPPPASAKENVVLPPVQETGTSHDPGKLQRHLWAAANILRGTVDSSDYRHYIFGLLFYKRLSDVWEEEYEARWLETGDEVLAADPWEHRFQIPRELLWNEVCGDQTPGIGVRLNDALRAIERAIPRLSGLFQDVDFAHRERFPDATLERLVRHFEKVRLRHSDVPPDMLGDAYEYLIKKFANDAGKKGGEFYTPKEVVQLLVHCLDPQPGHSIYDPACGSGGMLLEAVAYVQRADGDASTLQLYGQERNLNTWGICQMNLFLHDIENVSVRLGDTLRSPQHLDPSRGEMKIRQFDRVLANPPFSLRSWGHEVWADGDPYGRNVFGCPPPHYGDLAFVQHMLESLRPDGMLGVVLPLGVLFRTGKEGKIRRGLLEEDLIEAVIGLPENLFYGTGIAASLLILHRAKRPERQGKVLFVDGSKEMVAGKQQAKLSPENVERLCNTFRQYSEHEGFSRVVELSEIAAQGFSLLFKQYLATPETESQQSVPELLAAIEEQMKVAESSRQAFFEAVQELGYHIPRDRQ